METNLSVCYFFMVENGLTAHAVAKERRSYLLFDVRTVR